MKQQKDSLFFQSQLYVAELCEAMNVMEFIGEAEQQENRKESSKIEKLEFSNKSDNHDNSNKSSKQLL